MFSRFRSLLTKQPLHLHAVDLGTQVIMVPVADIQGATGGKTLVVTAGMDGDESSGIAAAYKLIEMYQAGNIAGRLIVLPLVNIPGFQAECSQNPLDHKFPKEVFPGRPDGSPTERLVSWLSRTYLESADVWYDLHSGALHERLHPFLWTYKTGVPQVDAWTESFHRQSGADWILYQPAALFSKYLSLAKKGCAYVMAEAGERGFQREHDTNQHLEWLSAAMANLRMIEQQESKATHSPTIFQALSYVFAPTDGIWSPEPLTRAELPARSVLGTYHPLDDIRTHELKTVRAGVPLWWKETMRMQKGELLCALARR